MSINKLNLAYLFFIKNHEMHLKLMWQVNEDID